MSEKLGITKIQTSPYHPQTNAHVERFNRYLVTAMRIYVNSTFKNWDKQLPAIAFAYRTAVNSSTGYTPYFLIHGTNARLPADIELDIEVNEKEYKNNMIVNHLRSAFKAVRRMEHESVAKNKRAFDSQHKEVKFNIGDSVMLMYLNKLLNKLQRRCNGPYKIIAQTFPVNYKIKGRTSTDIQIVHVNRIRKYHI